MEVDCAKGVAYLPLEAKISFTFYTNSLPFVPYSVIVSVSRLKLYCSPRPGLLFVLLYAILLVTETPAIGIGTSVSSTDNNGVSVIFTLNIYSGTIAILPSSYYTIPNGITD